jgi:hypothetical protein
MNIGSILVLMDRPLLVRGRSNRIAFTNSSHSSAISADPNLRLHSIATDPSPHSFEDTGILDNGNHSHRGVTRGCDSVFSAGFSGGD